MKNGPRKKYPDVWCYTDMRFKRTLNKGLNDAQINLHDYKGHILLSVSPTKLGRIDKLAETSGVHVGANAWLDGDELDTLIATLREAKREWLKHYRHMKKVAACADCAKVFGGMCKRHAKRKR